jgi:triacylglycerol esterase/lipase EstA (alpha/beta hydrolase family)
VHEFHRCEFYKVKYLKTLEAETKKMFAFPNGLPNFDKVQKIHFVGHSMGAMTAQYLSYLLKIGYFDELHGQPKSDRSGMIASITSISGANNGSYVINNVGCEFNEETHDWKLDKKSKMVRAFRYTIFC